MKIKKGTQIAFIIIDKDGKMNVTLNRNGVFLPDRVNLTREQRKLFTSYDQPDFLDNVRKEFGRDDVLKWGFYIDDESRRRMYFSEDDVVVDYDDLKSAP